ncbi:MAG: DUF2141 domain-containing protein [Sulfuritalea sp.]|nr:DUF2141 domain-containing protein [Sulfuritalea sp.]MDP1983922.1 DUF2141 domain-containing protein [Sulfuritalea sp.]
MDSNFRFLPLLALIALAGAGTADFANAADLSIEITGHQPSRGKLRVALFGDSASFLATPLKTAESSAAADPALLVFRDLPAGMYALSAYQDDNGNNKLDRGTFNIPVERHGFSRDARGDGGPPAFRDAQIELREPAVKYSIKLR